MPGAAAHFRCDKREFPVSQAHKLEAKVLTKLNPAKREQLEKAASMMGTVLLGKQLAKYVPLAAALPGSLHFRR